MTFDDAAPVIPVRDLEAALDRYRRLGFETRAYRHGTGYGDADREGVSLHLSAWDEHDPERTGEGRLAEPRDTDFGKREFAYVDPDDTLHRVGSRLD